MALITYKCIPLQPNIIHSYLLMRSPLFAADNLTLIVMLWTHAL